MERFSLNRLDFQAVFFIETYQNVVIGLCQVIYNTFALHKMRILVSFQHLLYHAYYRKQTYVCKLSEKYQIRY